MTENEPIEKETEAKKKVVRKKIVAHTEAPAAVEPVAAVEVKHHVKRRVEPKEKRFYGLGRRKTARAKVWMAPGSGKITVNQKTPEEYFCNRIVLLASMLEPFKLTNTEGKMDAEISLSGGGVSAQADAIKQAVAQALLEYNPELRKILRQTDMLRRDPRMKERKKYGLKRARRAFQYTKR